MQATIGIIAGILIMIISIAHHIYGEKKQIPDLKKITNDPVQIGSLRIMIYQGGVLLLFAGILQLLASTGTLELTGISAFFPMGIVAVNFFTSLVIISLFHREVFRVIIPQLIFFTVILILQVLALVGS